MRNAKMLTCADSRIITRRYCAFRCMLLRISFAMSLALICLACGTRSTQHRLAEAPVSETRTCDKCNFTLPLTASHFDRKRDGPDGFRTTCKTCRKEQREDTKNALASPSSGNLQAGVDEISESLDSQALTLLRSLSADRRRSTDVPHEAEVYQEIMARFGGASGFADHLMAQFLAAGPGSAARLSLLRLTATMSANVGVEQLLDRDALIALEAEFFRSCCWAKGSVAGGLLFNPCVRDSRSMGAR